MEDATVQQSRTNQTLDVHNHKPVPDQHAVKDIKRKKKRKKKKKSNKKHNEKKQRVFKWVSQGQRFKHRSKGGSNRYAILPMLAVFVAVTSYYLTYGF